AHLDHRDLRHQQGFALGALELDLHQHARAQQALGVVEVCAHAEGAAAGVHARTDVADLALEGQAAPGGAGAGDVLALGNVRQVRFGHREVDVDRRQVDRKSTRLNSSHVKSSYA